MSSSVCGIIAGLFGVCTIVAAGPEGHRLSQPKQLAPGDRPDPSYLGLVVDTTRPGYIPDFSKSRAVVALQEERDHAIRLEPRPWLISSCGYVGSVYIPWYSGCP